jgi:hypothetical protein
VRNSPTSESETSPARSFRTWAGLRGALAGAVLLLASGGPDAIEVANLYRAEIAVPGKDEAARPDAFRHGLEQVLGRVVRPEDLGSAAVRSLLAKPEAVLLEFVYPGTVKAGQPILRMDFDGERIRSLLRAKGIGVFGPARPETLVWIDVEDEQPARILSSDALPDWDRLIDELAAERGLPLTLPLADLTDQQSLAPADIAAGNAERIKAASQRYEPETILAGRVIRKPEGYEADWRLYRGAKEERWQGKSPELREALNSGVTGAYSRIAGQFVAHGTGLASLELKVNGIASLDDVNSVTAYLSKLSSVAKAEMLSLDNDQALFRLSVRGGRDWLEQTLAMGTRLRPESGGPPGFSGLTYRLAR